ncbi:hypothetical protein D9619_009618 [Psilocybe cf. subviscida]|uniref:Aminoglycoside phosphotransferase domain-containing protein n=1 Tax=Psilocybe cf. subviscida TaxID=2480587 RepID=A0A8H5BLI6_9AGAR|nr:hypothetical protein D9619_009618 [Psilocybe cf. subviscida]
MSFLRMLFLLLRLVLGPSKRRKIYLFIEKFSRKFYGDKAGGATRFPMNLYFKEGMNSVNEVMAIQLVKQQLLSHATKTMLPLVPEVLDVADGCFIMTRLPGEPLGNMYSKLSDEERAQVTPQVTEFIKVLRSIPNSLESERSRPLGKVSGPLPHLPASDNNRIWEEQFGPFPTLPEFHSFLLHLHRRPGSFPERYSLAHDFAVSTDPRNLQETEFSTRTVFSHCDLHLRNILAERKITYERGQPVSKIVVTGIIDWECAGWFPIYWDHAKAVWRHRAFKKYRDCWQQIAKDTIPPESLEKYDSDLALEEEMWTYMDF